MNATVLLPAVSDADRRWAGATHLACLVLALCTSWVLGLAGMLPALVVYLVQSDRRGFAARHAAEAFNFNGSVRVQCWYCAKWLISGG